MTVIESHRPIGEWLAEALSRYADQPAVADDAGVVTFAELHARAESLSSAMIAEGLVPGDRILVNGCNSVDWVVVNLACYRAGIVRVAVSPRLRGAELARMVEHCSPRWWFTDASWVGEQPIGWADEFGLRTVTLGTDPVDPGLMTTTGLPDLVSGADSRDLEPVPPDAPAWISYTSGSTGLPKGVIHTQRSITATVRNMLSVMRSVGPGDVALHTAPLSHYSGHVLLGMLASGAHNLLEPAFDAGSVLLALVERGVSVLPVVPTQISMMLEHLDVTGAAPRVPDLRMLIYAGSPIPPAKAIAARDRFGEVLLQLYGSTEAQLPLAALAASDHVLREGCARSPIASAGRIPNDVEVAVLRDDGSIASQGEEGEVASRGPHVTPGYWESPEVTAEAFDAAGWFRTGDVGVLEGGFLYLVGRRKELIISGGFNVYPAEVENVLAAYPGVREAAVIGAPSARWGEEVRAFVTVQPGSEVSDADLLAHCRNVLAGYKVPKRIDFLDEFPRTSTGKTLKSALVRGSGTQARKNS